MGAVTTAKRLLPGLDEAIPDLQELYEDLHRHPELGFLETRTAGLAAKRLTAAGYRVISGIGKTGVAGVLQNGSGPVVLLRADMDALPIKEETGLPYASTVTQRDLSGRQVPVAHACGHDVHVTCLLGAASLLATSSRAWAGTLIALFQPNEEDGKGAQAMVDDSLYDKVPKPDVVLAQHVTPAPAGLIAYRDGPCMAAADRFKVIFHGVAGHGSRPEATIDPVLMAAAYIQRLQGIVSREVAAADEAVVTVGSIHGGSVPNEIPEQVELQLDLRSYTPEVRSTIIAAVKRIAAAETAASSGGTGPSWEVINTLPVVDNDTAVLTNVNKAFAEFCGEDTLTAAPAASGSEDVGALATAAGAPIYYWWLGGYDPSVIKQDQQQGRRVPSNHSPQFAPAEQPTLTAGVQALVVAALSQLAAGRRLFAQHGDRPAGAGGGSATSPRRLSSSSSSSTRWSRESHEKSSLSTIMPA